MCTAAAAAVHRLRAIIGRPTIRHTHQSNHNNNQHIIISTTATASPSSTTTTTTMSSHVPALTTQSDAAAVREFTAGAGQPTPSHPEAMSKEQVLFISKMIVDEVSELLATVCEPQEAKAALVSFVKEGRDLPLGDYTASAHGGDENRAKAALIGDQADALVDSYYYSLNAAAKCGVNLSSLFQVVHAANMAKRCPKTGEFLKRPDGKIIKPEGWTAPDITAEIERQMQTGAFPGQDKAVAAAVDEKKDMVA